MLHFLGAAHNDKLRETTLFPLGCSCDILLGAKNDTRETRLKLNNELPIVIKEVVFYIKHSNGHTTKIQYYLSLHINAHIIKTDHAHFFKTSNTENSKQF